MHVIIRSNNHSSPRLIKDNAMHISRLLHKLFHTASKNLDKRIHKTLLSAVMTLSEHKQLSIFGLGRFLDSRAKVKHTIKRIDRLFGNKVLHNRLSFYYQHMASILVNSNPRPIILVDWSGLTKCGTFHFLRASVPVGGRSLTILDMCFQEADYGSYKAHKLFLKQLKKILPEFCCPIIVTDAGYRCPWFKLVTRMGWDFIGRVRNRTLFQEKSTDTWLPVKTLFAKATNKPTFVLSGLLAKTNSIVCDFYMLKEIKKHRVRANLRGKKIQCSVSKKHAKRGREPLLIATSLNRENYSPSQLIKIYKKRMQIEEAFRDIKNTKNGFNLRHCRSFNLERLNVALLIGNIAMLLLWILGLAAKNKKVHFSFQANTVRTKNVLSTFIIGWQYMRKKGKQFLLSEFQEAIRALQSHASAL